MVWPRIRNFVHGPTAALLFALASVLAGSGVAAQSADPHAPKIGQLGKDVIWVPTSERAVERMLSMAKVGPSDFVIDLGSGDGRIVITAAQRFGARGLGVDLDPNLVKLSEHRAAKARVSDRVQFHVRDIFHTDLQQATVVTLFLLTELNLRLRPSLLKLAPGTRIVANAFDMGEWEADELDTSTASALRLWIVPAPVAGTWRWSLTNNGAVHHYQLEMNQQFQRVSGVVRVGKRTLRLRDAKLRGTDLEFALLDQQRSDQGVRYTHVGRVNGDRIEGEIAVSEGGKRLRWVATRMTLKEGNDG